ncbi:alpha-catulin [Caerostris darwini]|uniref:Alpha-catulin n=1 Tax=Caerostris darwini TaxID=1538125 RepID=A0AAV4MJ72_9ARAC|nr:alpha-catulin [Caerostris darwini]
MAVVGKHEPLSLEIRTKSIEKTLVPLVNQITTLVNAKEKPIKSEKTLRAIVHVGQAVNFAVQKFVSVGEAIADDNCEIKSDMYEACKDARTAGSIIEQLCDVKPDECGQLRSYADKNNMVRAARTLLSSVTRVLLLADTVVVKQLIAIKDRVSISLNRLELAANFTEFVKAFSQFGSEMVELAHLTGDRQNDLKDERRRSQMAIARQILERSTMMLLTSSKVCFRHPECIASRDNRNAIFHQMHQALELINFVTKDGMLSELSADISSVQNNRSPHHDMSVLLCTEELEQSNSLYNAIKHFEDIVEITRMTLVGPPYREKLKNALDGIMERTQDFTDSAYTSHAHREKILLLCDRARLELNQLFRIGVTLDQSECTSPTEDLEAAILQVLRATKDLKQELQDTALDHTHELLRLFEETDILSYMKTSSLAGDQDRLEEYSEKFTEYAEHVQDACKLLQHIASTECTQVTSKNVESSLKVFAAQVLNSCRTVALHPMCEISKENLEVFIEMWNLLCQDVTSIYKEISELCRRDIQYKTVYMSLPRPGKHGTTSKSLKPVKLDVEEQAKIAKLGLEMKLLTSEIDAETERWSSSENDLCKRARSMSQMAFSMYQFTRGEGDLKTTQDLFTQAEFFAEEANKLYKLVRQFSYLVPGGQHKNELLEYLDKVPTFVQQLQFTVKNPTVGKAATFTKVDNVIQETKNLMNVISKVVTTCLFCATKYNIDFHSLTSQAQTASPYQNDLEDYVFDRSIASNNVLSKDSGQNSSKPNI